MKAILIAALCLWVTLDVGAQNERRLSVNGHGEAKAAPAKLIINFEIAATDEVAPEALKKFTAKQKLVEKTAASLEIKDVKVVHANPKFAMKRANPYMMEQQGGKAPEYEVFQKVSLHVAGLDQMDEAKRIETAAAIVDALSQASLISKPNPNAQYEEMNFGVVNTGFGGGETGRNKNDLAAFDIVDTKKLEDDAMKAAVADAKKRAQFLAELNGVKVGKVLRISAANLQKNWNLTSKECSVSMDVSVDYEIVD